MKNAFFIVEPNQKQLADVAGLIAAGRLRTVVDKGILLSEAPLAFCGELERRGRGKIVVTPAGEIGQSLHCAAALPQKKEK